MIQKITHSVYKEFKVKLVEVKHFDDYETNYPKWVWEKFLMSGYNEREAIQAYLDNWDKVKVRDQSLFNGKEFYTVRAEGYQSTSVPIEWAKAKWVKEGKLIRIKDKIANTVRSDEGKLLHVTENTNYLDVTSAYGKELLAQAAKEYHINLKFEKYDPNSVYEVERESVLKIHHLIKKFTLKIGKQITSGKIECFYPKWVIEEFLNSGYEKKEMLQYLVNNWDRVECTDVLKFNQGELYRVYVSGFGISRLDGLQSKLAADGNILIRIRREEVEITKSSRGKELGRETRNAYITLTSEYGKMELLKANVEKSRNCRLTFRYFDPDEVIEKESYTMSI